MANESISAETERLLLRRYRKNDLRDLFEYLSDEKVVEYEPYRPMTADETEKNLEWRISTDEMVAVELKSILLEGREEQAGLEGYLCVCKAEH